MVRLLTTSALVVVLAAAAVAQQQQQQRPPSGQNGQQPARDTSAQTPDAAPTPTGRIAGRVVSADSGRPIKRARVSINAAELQGGRGVLTDDSGIFDFTELPAGRYSVSVSKSGFVSLSYGQRRPLMAGTPLQLLDGQTLKGVDFQLPRGSVVGGHIFDEDGEAMAGVTVRVMRYQYQQGDRRLSPAGTGQTDDKGAYRVWGLMPGDYYVNAVARVQLPYVGGAIGGPGGRGGAVGGGGRGAAGGPAGGPGGAGGRGGGFQGAAGDATASGGGANVAGMFGNDQDGVSYAPTYYPGVAELNEAKAVTLGLSQELLDINFGMQLVKMSQISGHVTNPDGSPSTRGNVNLMTETSTSRGNQLGANFGGRVRWDGAFSIANVPPGRYVLRARGDDTDTPQFATLPLSVTGGDMPDVTVVLQTGATLAGSVSFPSTTQPPDPSQFRITAPALDAGNFGPQTNARLDKDGKFTLIGVPAGMHLIRSAGNARGWTLKSVTIGPRDVTDTPIEIRSGDAITNITVVFTDKVNEINGTVTDTSGAAASEYTVLVFPTDNTLWRPQSRQIMTTRPDQTGSYKIRGLPPGDYYLVTVDPAEQGEWFDPDYLNDHRAGASKVTLSDGDVKTQNLRVKS